MDNIGKVSGKKERKLSGEEIREFRPADLLRR